MMETATRWLIVKISLEESFYFEAVEHPMYQRHAATIVYVVLMLAYNKCNQTIVFDTA